MFEVAFLVTKSKSKIFISLQTIHNGKPSFIMARVNDGRNVRDISILKDSFKSNLKTCLDFYEQVEEYELCSRTVKLINQVK